MPSQEVLGIVVQAAHVKPHLGGKEHDDLLLSHNLAHGKVTSGADTVVQEVVNIGLLHRSEGGAGNQCRIISDPTLAHVVNKLNVCLNTLAIGVVSLSGLTLTEEHLSLDHTSLGIGTNHCGRSGTCPENARDS